jgi:hypothetical protein
MRDRRPDCSSSWTFVLPSSNLRHHFLTFDSLPVHCNKLRVNFNLMDILCIQKPNYSSYFTIGGILDILTHFVILWKIANNRLSVPFTWLLTKRLLRPLILKLCNSLTCASAMCKCSLLSGWTSYYVYTSIRVYIYIYIYIYNTTYTRVGIAQSV